ncbi:type I glyceraldehyde-3-phosphate dehydrogenase [Pseudobacteriovorax antillogorgiicola]|uniref:Glyceraldehyde-3-phosphate dehydrogenase (NAD+) n=1 Tax=Pseudobacteriovorax antillogorgiicola TaxID=1513793 RepID=A0A1Y6BV53_9BACT|nr:type I glyceraldehyde-3-phosphate dehydrogenase [Pseudobacteriovorax antillogorgiicola]TCS53824.1 glyceraldehyde-3-phosphate dehydrogenase (NAD+) [Pseudobacteriovorax antillogorgiicola]SMF21835.1 glyceraldehyde-3-phosphate dehydrogenase (NAD+) [Pseudobacteriovorax antillogorgiicola]
MTVRVGINGFGRIGRVVMRAALRQGDVEVAHINDLTDTKTLAHLLKYDSVHGVLDADVTAKDGAIIVNGKEITVSAVRDPKELPWSEKNIDLVLECTGLFTKREDAERHIAAGAKKVLISAPAKGEDVTVVYGVNHDKLTSEHTIVSNGSCTTNCLAPVAKVLNDNWGIQYGQMTTVHAYTNDQKVLDLPHKDLRRARAAGLSMIPTSTGAAKAISLVLPELSGKLSGMAVRVPTANVSLVDLTVHLEKETSVEDVNKALKEAAEGPLKGVLAFSDEPLVSIDYNGTTVSSTVDGLSTIVSDGKMVKVLSWYDNESGFSNRMLDVARLMAK